MPSLAASLAWSEGSVNGSDGQFECSVPVRIRVRDGVPARIAHELLARVELLCQPCGAEIAGQALMTLRALVATRSGSEIGIELQAAAYTTRLAAYPADAVIAACEEWPSTSAWWPAWHELQRLVERRSGPRQSIRAALRHHLAQ